MSYFPDLSPYSYSECEYHPGVLHVGWLGCCHAYRKGTVPEEVVEKLKVLAAEPVQLSMGYHVCELCRCPEHLIKVANFHPDGPDFPELWQPLADWERPRRSNGEIRVTYKGVTYAAPVLIVHNIEEHGYQPPAVFLEAVMNGAAYQPLGFVSQLPEDMLSKANLEVGKPAWRLSDFARVLQHATAHRLACLGGQYELRRPDGSVDGGLSRVYGWTLFKGQSWDDYVEYANALTLREIEASVSEKDLYAKMFRQKSISEAIASAKMADPLEHLYFTAQFGRDPVEEIARSEAASALSDV